MELHEALAAKVDVWRDGGYPSDVPGLGEILEFATEGGTGGTSHRRYLRAAQLRALETYWYLRVVERTPSIPELYRRLMPATSERLTALGLGAPALTALALDLGYDGLLTRIRTDDAFVKANKLGILRETLTLDYPSYILALAMGAGKTVLIGAIVAPNLPLPSTRRSRLRTSSSSRTRSSSRPARRSSSRSASSRRFHSRSSCRPAWSRPSRRA